MNLKKLSFALACSLAVGHAGAAVSLDPHGLGQGLLFPYFTTYNGQDTLISVQNTTSQGKALKVNVLESMGGVETLAFNVYLPPFGQWSGSLTLKGYDSEDSYPFFVPSAMNSGCTLVEFPPEGMHLGSYGFDGDDQLPYAWQRISEGSVEIIEMGTLNAELTALVTSGSDADCGKVLSRGLNGGIWKTDPGAGIGAPTGKLRGSAVLIDVAGGTSFAYSAVAFNGLATTQRHNPVVISEAGNIHTWPVPRLTDVQTVENADIKVDVMTTEGIQTLRYPSNRGYDAIAALLATTQAFNTFNVDPGLRSRTEWIVSFPTLRAHFAGPGGKASGPLNPAPFSVDCDTLPVVAWNTQGTKIEATTPIKLCYSGNVIRFAGEGGALDPLIAKANAPIVTVDADAGAARLDFRKLGENGVRTFAPDLDGKCVLGLPAWVMAVQSYDNDNAQEGRIATYPVSNVASGPVEVVDCDSLDD